MARTHLSVGANEAQRSFDGEATSTPQDIAIENEGFFTSNSIVMLVGYAASRPRRRSISFRRTAAVAKVVPQEAMNSSAGSQINPLSRH